MKAVLIKEVGGPEKMVYEEVNLPAYDSLDVLVKLSAAGVNYIDTYQRSGRYPVTLPHILGMEGAGVVEAIGSGVTDFSVGDRVAFTTIPSAYAEYVKVPQERLVKVPKEVSIQEACAAMLQGCTAHYLTHSTYPLKPGDTCLIHAAAGGMGLLNVQMAKLAGARTIGTVSTDAKATLAQEAGLDEVILYTQQDFEKEVRRLTDGQGVDVVYDAVGKETFAKSLKCLKPRGMMVLYGNASGAVTEFSPTILAGSLFFTRPTLFDYIAKREELEQRTHEIFGWLQEKKLKLHIHHLFPLSEAQQAHSALEGRKTTGKILLTL